jgi:hypothetical protein
VNWHIALAALSVVLEVVSLIPYLRDIKHGTTRPNAVSFGIWTMLQAIAFAAQLEAGASWSAVMMGTLVFSTGYITYLSLTGYGYREFGRVEKTSLVIGLGAIVAWALTGAPDVAIFFALLADTSAFVPTVKKAYCDPESEHAGAWGIVAIGVLCSALSTEKYDFANLAYPLYLTVADTLVWALAYFGQRARQRRAWANTQPQSD